jgi:peptidyl-prolyl cis-trans isomerase SurA
MVIRRCACAVATVLVFCTAARPAHLLDGVAAVVGDDIVLLSELEAYSLMRMNEMRIRPDSINAEKLRLEFLDEIIEGKVLLEYARKDSTIRVSPQEVEAALGEHIGRLMKANNLTQAELERELTAQGMTMSRFKTQLRRSIQDQLLRRNVQQLYMADVRVTKHDVEEFYREYRDSLPTLGESWRLLRLVIKVPTPDSVRQTAYAKIKRIKTRLDNGESFEEVAKLFSEDPSAQSGGDMGFISKGSLDELAFEEAAFALQPGQVSDLVQTRFGYHVIKAIARKDQRVHIKQIFVAVSPPADVEQAVSARLDSIRAACSSREDFERAVEAFSTDARTKARKGDAGWFASLQIPDAQKEAFETFALGAVSRPFREGDTYVLMYAAERVDDRPLSVDNDYDMLAEKARDVLSQKKLIELVERWRDKLYIDVRIE